MKNSLTRFLASATTLLALAAAAHPAHAFEIAIEGGMNINSFTATNSGTGTSSYNSETSKAEISYGAFVGFGVFPGFQLETGLFRATRHSIYNDSTMGLTDIKFTDLMIPAILRFNLLPVLSIGAGPYLGLGTGKFSLSSPSGSAELDFGTTSIKSSEFGVMGSVRAAFPLAPTLSLLLDGRYVMGLSSRDNDPADSLKFKDLQILGGVSFNL